MASSSSAGSQSESSQGEGSCSCACHVLLTNLAAACFEQQRLEECIEAADHSIALEPSWLKAYYRKALALEALPGADPQAVLRVWEAADRHCSHAASSSSALLKKQLLVAKARWLQHFKQAPVSSSSDLLARYSLLQHPRERLSTMAHFWNASNKVRGKIEGGERAS